MDVLQHATMIFLISNPVSIMPFLVNSVKDLPIRRKKIVLFREALVSLFIAYAFLIFGEPFLQIFHIQEYSIKMGGGVIVFLFALQMIFPSQNFVSQDSSSLKEPFIVPIAIPLLCGAGVLSSILIVRRQLHFLNAALAISLAWIPIIFLVVAAAFLHKLLGKRGFLVLEQLAGLFLMMMSVNLVVSGFQIFLIR